jgi:hypothetical protein
MDCEILKTISLGAVKATGKTKHFIGGQQMQKSASLQIRQ